VTRPLSVADLEDLRRAHGLLESDSFAIRLATLLGEPIEAGLRLLPEAALGSVQQTTRTALRRALRVALRTLPADAAAAELRTPLRPRRRDLALGKGRTGWSARRAASWAACSGFPV
jgi:hypothetical protein